MTSPTARAPCRTTCGAVVGLLALALGSLVAAGPSSGGAAAPAAARHASIKVATFNVLGSQHTRGPGGRGPGKARARITSDLVTAKRLDLVGLQEVQADQLLVLKRRLDDYRIWPAYQLGHGTLRLQIAWRERAFDLLDRGTLVTKFVGQNRPVPWVLLRHRASGRSIYVVDIHNSPRGRELERDRALGRQIKLLQRFRATGRTVLVLGDLNERAEAFCKVVGRTDLVAANGGYVSRRRCEPPERGLRVDWIFGRGLLEFSDYVADDGPLVRKVSDHRMIRATVTLRRKPRS
ncbi:endonuclease/exonuclease/phosphatase family protein [Nocardioides psychrotolerans]|uniref:endonuclease/exonuclease/phosphatase family protein n=1 Tax=Nocardioides psychrotolerans TaxID=1005945 RepID=UPI0014791EA3|nr:endonuclease/exonuclease/phosphatase family protein [Nocardioides psychrotolerans]